MSARSYTATRLAEARRELERARQRVCFLYPRQDLEYRDSPTTVLALTLYVESLEARVATEQEVTA